MPDFRLLNLFRVTDGPYATTPEDGFNGMFRIRPRHRRLLCLASDGMDWKHVSVSIPGHPEETPTWNEMCMVKDLFFDPEEVAVQYHPPRSQWVNHHPGCLHLFSPTDQEMPQPPHWMVGPLEDKKTPAIREDSGGSCAI